MRPIRQICPKIHRIPKRGRTGSGVMNESLAKLCEVTGQRCHIFSSQARSEAKARPNADLSEQGEGGMSQNHRAEENGSCQSW